MDGADGALTPTRNMPSFTHPTQRRAGRECGSHAYGAVRMCACQGTEQTYRVALLQTLNTALQRALGPAINGCYITNRALDTRWCHYKTLALTQKGESSAKFGISERALVGAG